MKAVQVLGKAFWALHPVKFDKWEETFMGRNRLPHMYSEILVIPIPYTGKVRAVYFGIGAAGTAPNFWMCVNSDNRHVAVTRTNVHLLRKPVRYKQ